MADKKLFRGEYSYLDETTAPAKQAIKDIEGDPIYRDAVSNTLGGQKDGNADSGFAEPKGRIIRD